MAEPRIDPAFLARLLARAAAGPLWVPAAGGSMRPALHAGDSVRVRPGGVPKPGEVWLAVLPDGRLVAHRVRAVSADAVRLYGDARDRVDPPLARDLLVGRVDAVERLGRIRRVGRRGIAGRLADRLRRRMWR